MTHYSDGVAKKWLWGMGLLLGPWLPAGCDVFQPEPAAPVAQEVAPDTGTSGVPQPSPRVIAINLFSMPMALNFDDKPGADGFQVRVSFIEDNVSHFVELLQGRVEFLMYDGRVSPAQLAQTTPLRVWSYEARDLKARAQKSIVGWNYLLALAWGDTPPKQRVISVTVRLLQPDGNHLYAVPLSLTVH